MISGSLRRRVIKTAATQAGVNGLPFTCPFCNFEFIFGVEDPNINVDHITPRASGGTDDESNLQITCRSCNKSKQTYLAPVSNRKNISRLVLCSCGKRFSLSDFDYHVNIDLVRTNAILCKSCLGDNPDPVVYQETKLPQGFQSARNVFKKMGLR